MIYNEIRRLQNAKEAIKTAIEATGTTVPDDARLDEYASLIGGGSGAWHAPNPLRIINLTDELNTVFLYYKNAVGLEYSFDGSEWITPVETRSGALLGYVEVPLRGLGSTMYFRAKHILTTSSSKLLSFTKDAKLEGNFSSLCESGEGAMICNLGHIFAGGARLTEVGEFELPQPQRFYEFTLNALFANCRFLRKIGPITIQSDFALPANFTSSLFSGCTALTEVGDITIDVNDGYDYACQNMFYGCSSLVTPPKIKITGRSGSSLFAGCFRGCTSLRQVAEIEHPSDLVGSCLFQNMYYGCTALTEAVVYQTDSIKTYEYNGMYNGCTALTTVPELPATTLAAYCYAQMFYNCTSLVEGPSELPATSMVTSCYDQMFSGCTALTTAPVIRATSWYSNAAKQMFYNCRSLNRLDIWATNWSSQTNWVSNVAATGEFHKKAGVTISTGTSGIPTGWTVIEDVE